jgi:hypothetical protein
MKSLRQLKFKIQRRKREGLPSCKPVYAFDTENRPGEPAEVFCSSKEPRIVHSLDDCLKLMTGRIYRGALNVFWNMDFDISSIFKYEPDLFEQLWREQEAEYKDYSFSYIDEKKFTIRKDKHKWSFYDVQQYFRDQTPSLAGAARKYLGKEVDELKGDRAKLFELYEPERIAQYCMNDCLLTKELTEYLLGGLGKLGFYPPDLMSVGSLSRKYCNQFTNVPLLNYIQDLEIIDAYYQAYQGGWFEIQKRGYMDAWGYDIVSAYPTIIQELPDIRAGRFYVISDFDEIEEEDTWGVILVQAQSRREYPVNPLSVKIGIQLFYASFDEPEYKWITIREYRSFKDFYHFTFLKGWVFRPFFKQHDKPFAKIIEQLYKIKESEKLAGRKSSAMYMTSKLIMNSIYGNTIQTTDTKEGTVTGDFFNPFYAAEITAFCRCTVWEAIKNNLENVIMIATDGVYTDKPLPIELGSGLGDWEMEHEGEPAVFHSSGVYQFRGSEAKGRGIGRQDFFTLFNVDSDVVDVEVQRRKKVKECLVQGRKEDVNNFVAQWKKLSIDGDIRREWINEPEVFKDLLNNKYESRPRCTSWLKENYKDKYLPNVVPWDPETWKEDFKYLYRRGE